MNRDAQAVPVIVVAPEIVLEDPEQGRDGYRQAIEAAGPDFGRVGCFLKQNGRGQSQHEQGQAVIAQQDPARDKPDGAADNAAEQQAGDRLVPACVRRQHAGGIGAGAKIGGMAQCNDPGITENEVERERKKNGDHNLSAQGHVVGQNHEGHHGHEPRQRFYRTPAFAALQKVVGGLIWRGCAVGHNALPNRPSGLASRMAIATA